MNLRLIDVTLSHAQLVPYIFPNVRDIKLPGILCFAVDPQKTEEPIAAVYLASPHPSERIEFVFDFYFFQPQSLEQYAQTLLAQIVALASAHRAPSLRLMKAVTTTLESEILENSGFRIELESIDYRVSTPHTLKYIHKHFGKVIQERIPDDVEIVDYFDPRQDQISRLCTKEFGALTHGHLGALGQLNDGNDYSCSKAIYRKGQFICSLGVAIEDRLANFEPLIISSENRNSWAFPFIIDQVVSSVLKKGINDARIVVHGTNTKIINFMQHLNAQAESYLRSYKMELDTKREKP